MDLSAFTQLLRIIVFFFNDTATTEIYTLSLHDALPISGGRRPEGLAPALHHRAAPGQMGAQGPQHQRHLRDRKSTRLNSSHLVISYAVFCLKKKKKMTTYARFMLCTSYVLPAADQ